MSKIEIPATVNGSAAVIRVMPEDLYRAVEAAYGGKEVEPAPLRIETPASTRREPEVDDWVHIKGTEITGRVRQLNRVGGNGRIKSVTIYSARGIDTYIVPLELLEIAEHPDIEKAAEAIERLYPAVVETYAHGDRRRIVREVMKVVAPNHPALRGQ